MATVTEPLRASGPWRELVAALAGALAGSAPGPRRNYLLYACTYVAAAGFADSGLDRSTVRAGYLDRARGAGLEAEDRRLWRELTAGAVDDAYAARPPRPPGDFGNL